MSNKIKLLLIVFVMATSSGCKLLQNMVRTMVLEPINFTEHIDDKLEYTRYRRLATSILDECEPRQCQNVHFARGFKYGFADYLLAGPRSAPPLPPRRYWRRQFQSAEGKCAASDWFQGYERGVQAACASGHRAHVTVALNPEAFCSGENYVTSRPDYNVICGTSYDQVVGDYVEPMVDPVHSDSPVYAVPVEEPLVDASADTQPSNNESTEEPSSTAKPDGTNPSADKPQPNELKAPARSPADTLKGLDLEGNEAKSPSDLPRFEPAVESVLESNTRVFRPGIHVQTGYRPVVTEFTSDVQLTPAHWVTDTEAAFSNYTEVRPIKPLPAQFYPAVQQPR